MKTTCTFFTAAAFFLLSGCGGKPEPEGVQSYTLLNEFFNNPPPEYRSAPLWDWNDRITEEGIDFQMREFKKAGIGGVFVHPRPGLITEYLSDDWFHLFDYTVQKGRELDMKVWIYDENSYPSGFAGGHVPAEMPDSYRHGAGLKMEIQEKLSIIPSDTIEVVLKKSGNTFTVVTPSIDNELGNQGPFYIFRKTYPDKSQWYGGFPYVDLLHEGVTEKFIEITMTRGYEKNREDFGNVLPGVFTDEPNLEAALSDGAIMRWTPVLWDAFEERYGYDLKVNLPSLAEEIGEWKKIRHDYYQLLLELFIDKWAKPWSRYCEEKGLKWTGHYWEHGWPEPTHGFDEAAFYIWHQQPGIDMLGNALVPAGQGGQFGNDRAVRELLSAANQAGRTRTLSETYGGGGWEMDFENQKRLVDWQCVLGVNFVNQHLSYYSLKGVRKFDYPPSFSYHEPWWEHYKLMGDYIGRVSLALSSGRQVNQTLVLQPNTTAWMYFTRTRRNPEVDSIRNSFKNFVYQLEQHHIEYDLGSENVIKTLGAASKGELKVGQRNYNLIVIPAAMENIDQTTLDLLIKYLETGGHILSFRSKISFVDGTSSAAVNDLSEKFSGQWSIAKNLNAPSVLKLLSRDEFTMEDQTKNGMLYHQRRILDDGQVLFFVNSHQAKSASARITVRGKYVTWFDLFTGETNLFSAEYSNGKVSFQVDLEPVGSALFAVTNRKPGIPEYNPLPVNESLVESPAPVTVKRESDNILMINYLDLKTSGSFKKDVYFMNALIGLFKENGVEMGNPWQHKIQYRQNYMALDSLFREASAFMASYHFRISDDLETEALQSIRAVVERPEMWQVHINGEPAEQIPGEYWIDRDFAVFDIGKLLKHGKNTLSLHAPRMNVLAEIMPVYILGDFLVKPADQGFQITKGDLESMGSWREAGLPFYSGKVAYTKTYQVDGPEDKFHKIRLNKWDGTLAEVSINGEFAGTIFHNPYELNITQSLKEGMNEITVKVYGSLKNTFGFFYNPNDSWIFGPHSWNYAPEKIPAASEYFLMDYGLFEPFELVRVE